MVFLARLGGQGSNEPTTESSVMKSYLVTHGLEKHRIVEENRSTNTRELTVMLPQDHRDTVRLEIYVGNETTPQVNMPVECIQETVVVSLTGTETQFVKVYFDSRLEEEQSHHMQFN